MKREAHEYPGGSDRFKTPHQRRLAVNIRAYCIEKRISLAQFADLAGVGKSSVYRILSGSGSPSVAWLERVAANTDTKLEAWLAAASPDTQPPPRVTAIADRSTPREPEQGSLGVSSVSPRRGAASRAYRSPTK